MSLFNKTGLVAWYPFTEGSGTTLNDYKGTNNGTLTNDPTWQKEKDGGCSIRFDGTNDSINFTSVTGFPSGNEASFCVWNYGVLAKQSTLISGTDGSYQVFNIHLPWEDNVVYWDCGNVTSSVDRINKAVTASEYQGWHFWVFTKNASTGIMKIFLDGNEWHSDTGKTRTINSATIVRFASYPSNLYYHQGKMKDVLIFDRELKLNEIKDLYRKTYIE